MNETPVPSPAPAAPGSTPSSSPSPSATLTKRGFVVRVAQAGGSAYAAMMALGLLAPSRAGAFTLPQAPGAAQGKRIVILGAGLAGMAAGYELGKLGYDYRILEARSRAGGRAWTVRRGTDETEVGGERQVAGYDEGQYLNTGPARIPQQHVTLDYCRELGVPVEVFANVNEAGYYYNENAGPLSGQRVRIREAKADMRGFTSELLAKAVAQDALDTPLTADDKEKLVDYLRREGSLNPDNVYRGGSRRGYAVEPGAGAQPGTLADPIDTGALIQSGFGNYFSAEYSYDQQMTMMQIVGGTDGIARGFERQVGSRITFGAEVTEIRKTPTGVRVLYTAGGAPQEIAADYCICTIPLSVLKDIPADFAPEMREAIGSIAYATTGKIGLQFKRRFWEEDDRIYGGMSRTNLSIGQIWYPSTGFMSQKGMVVGYYNFGDQAVEFGNLSPAGRLERSLVEGTKIHPQYPQEFETAFSVAWQKVKYSLGGWAGYTTATRQRYYPTLNRPDGPIYLAGEHLSYLTAWMAGALESARDTVKALHERVLTTA